jgi:dTDP-L-rhamnose 4-epimerase
MRVLVTGGAGLIGSHVVDDMLGAGHDVTVLDNLDPEIHPAGAPDWLRPEARFVEGDVRDPEALDSALQGCTAVVHLAAYGGFSPQFSKIVDVNCTGTSRVFEAIRRSGQVARVVTASSMAVYGEGWHRCADHGAFHGAIRSVERLDRGQWTMPCPTCGEATSAAPIPEASDVCPESAYASSKYFGERLTLSEGRDLGIATTALRFFLTFGPRQSVYNAYSGICSIFSTRVLNGLPPVVYEDGRQSRDMIFVADVARAVRLALEDPRAAGRVFNVARGQSVEIGDFAKRVADVHGVAMEPECDGRFRPMDSRHMLGDTRELAALGFEPKVGLQAGLERYVEWIRGLGDVREYFGEAEKRLKASGIVRPSGKGAP